MGSNVTLDSLEKAASAELILLFLPKDDLESVLQKLPDMSGKIILHTSSLIFDPRSLLSGITHAMTYKITASLLPKAHIVKLFNPIDLKPDSKCAAYKNREEIFFIADHKTSVNSARNFLKTLHFLPIDLTGRLHLQHRAMKLKSILTPQASSFYNKLN